MIDAYDELPILTLTPQIHGKAHRVHAVVVNDGHYAAFPASSASAVIVTLDDAGIVAEEVTYPVPGDELNGYFVTPKSVLGLINSVILIHENRGLNDHIHDVARCMVLAGSGY